MTSTGPQVPDFKWTSMCEQNRIHLKKNMSLANNNMITILLLNLTSTCKSLEYVSIVEEHPCKISADRWMISFKSLELSTSDVLYWLTPSPPALTVTSNQSKLMSFFRFHPLVVLMVTCTAQAWVDEMSWSFLSSLRSSINTVKTRCRDWISCKRKALFTEFQNTMTGDQREFHCSDPCDYPVCLLSFNLSNISWNHVSWLAELFVFWDRLSKANNHWEMMNKDG